MPWKHPCYVFPANQSQEDVEIMHHVQKASIDLCVVQAAEPLTAGLSPHSPTRTHPRCELDQ